MYYDSQKRINFLAKQEGTDTDILTGDGSENGSGFHKVILPEGHSCDNAIIQVQNPTITDFDPESDCSPFLYAPAGNPEGPGVLFSREGCFIECKAFKPGSVIGYVKAPAGFNIVMALYK